MELAKLINQISGKHRFLGEIAQESLECYENECFSSALFDLFILTEQFCKNSNDTTEGNFHQTINNLCQNNNITIEEKDILINLKHIRNKMFHENLAMWVFEIDGVAYAFSEQETRKILYEKHAEKIFEIILKLLEQDEI